MLQLAQNAVDYIFADGIVKRDVENILNLAVKEAELWFAAVGGADKQQTESLYSQLGDDLVMWFIAVGHVF